MQKFLLSVDPANNELYILHRLWPACLIHVVQEIPARFVIEDLYDNVDNVETIPGMPFIEEAKDFYRIYAQQIIGGN